MLSYHCSCLTELQQVNENSEHDELVLTFAGPLLLVATKKSDWRGVCVSSRRQQSVVRAGAGDSQHRVDNNSISIRAAAAAAVVVSINAAYSSTCLSPSSLTHTHAQPCLLACVCVSVTSQLQHLRSL